MNSLQQTDQESASFAVKPRVALAGPVNGGRLQSFIERIEKLLEERKAIGGDIRDVFAEAKSVGYDVRTMRKLITVRAMDAADRAEQETLLDTYAHALGMDTSGTLIEPTEEELIDRATRIVQEVDRCMMLPRDPLPTIKAIMAEIGCSVGKAHKLRLLVEQRISSSGADHREMKNEIARALVDGDLGEWLPPHTPATGEVIEDAAPQESPSSPPQPAPNGGVGTGTESKPEEITPSAFPPPEAGKDRAHSAAPQSLYQRITGAFPKSEEDDFTIPPFLRRSPELVR